MAITAGITEYVVTGGLSTWVPLWSGLAGVAAGAVYLATLEARRRGVRFSPFALKLVESVEKRLRSRAEPAEDAPAPDVSRPRMQVVLRHVTELEIKHVYMERVPLAMYYRWADMDARLRKPASDVFGGLSPEDAELLDQVGSTWKVHGRN